jgi:hypothetical protein
MYNIAEWVPVTEGLQSRHYHNVAERRAMAETSSSLGLARTLLFPPLGNNSSTISSSSLSSSVEQQHALTSLPEEESIDNVLHEEENKSWDFMTSQMADWQKRSLSSHKTLGDRQIVGSSASTVTTTQQRTWRWSISTATQSLATTDTSTRLTKRSPVTEEGVPLQSSLKRLKKRMCRFVAGI